MVLFHTGSLIMVGEDNERSGKAWPEEGGVAMGAHNWGLEVIPFEDSMSFFDVHQNWLAKNGVNLLETVDT
ncbi:hypothetical protein [Marinobacter zhanjiangensis]|uniref:Uncharacterized protein n=1 Tax=Marinobacter zhanjiangensis TaxID=578215 RepID=A0ABQ3AQQ5_9GAMM|nr:hypothetical protein [Marinobacter zhanjiangensis]GGY63222.1 hypothetical protein GCM10007071_07220 [Marinobacter zhanjiangensis]